MAKTATLGAIGLAALVAACGGGAEDARTGRAPAGKVASTGAAKVLDACATLDKSMVEQSVGGKVQTADLSAVHAGSEGLDRFSQCTYGFRGLHMLVFGSGESSDGSGEDVAHLTQRMREQMQQASDTAPEAVPGIGKGGLWNRELHALYVFMGDGRFWSFTLYQVGEPDPKAAAIALARKLGA